MTETDATIRYLDMLCYHKTTHLWGVAVKNSINGARLLVISVEEGKFRFGYRDPMGGFELLELLAGDDRIAKKLAEPMDV